MNATSPQWRNHAAVTQALAARGLAAAAAEAARAWAGDFPQDAIALRAAAELCEAARDPAAGDFYLRAHAVEPGHVATALRAAFWWATRHRGLDRLAPILETVGRTLDGIAGGEAAQMRYLASLAALRAGEPALAAALAAGAPELAPHARLTAWLRDAIATAPGLAPAGCELVLTAAVWGRAFGAAFARASLASLAHGSNLPAFVGGRRAAFLIFADAAARAEIEAAPASALLARHADIRYVDVPDAAIAGNPGTNVLGPVQHVGFHAAAARGADSLFVHTDAVYSTGSLAHVRRLADAGCDIFCTSGFSATTGEMLAAIDRARADDGSLALAPRRLAAQAFACMHPRSRAMLVRADDTHLPSHTSLVLFAERDYLRMRYFQPGPIWIARRMWNPGLRFAYDTSDNGLLHRLVAAAPFAPKIVFGADSDDFLIVDLADGAQATERTAQVDAGGDVAAAIHADARARGFIDALRIDAFSNDCRIVSDGPPPWPPAPDCGALLARIEALCRADLAAEAAASAPRG